MSSFSNIAKVEVCGQGQLDARVELVRRFSVDKAVITGGTRGIGHELVTLLTSQLGAAVVTCGRDHDRVTAFNSNNPNAEATLIDLTERRELFSETQLHRNPLLLVANNAGYEFGRDAVQKLGGAKLLILNAGISGLDPAEKLTTVSDLATLANRWYVSTLGTYLACEEALKQSGGTVVFVSSPLIHQRHHMPEGLPPTIEPYVKLKEAIRRGLWKLYTRHGGPLDSMQSPPMNLMYLEPGSVDTDMHRETKFGDQAIAERSARLRAEGRLRDPSVVARIILRMGASCSVFNPAETTSVIEGSKAARYTYVATQNWVHAITDEAYQYEMQHLDKAVLDPWWF